MADGTINPRELRQALGGFATGVTIVTTRDAEERPVGLTANSFNSVSLDPPLVLWSLALNSGNLPAFRHAGWWAVHILSAAQEDLSTRFATRGTDKFAGLSWTEGEGGVPLLEGCAARFLCRTAFEYEGGDHAIFVGAVAGFHATDAAPLIFHGGRYGRIMPRTEKPAPIEPGDTGEFGRHFLGHLLGRARHEVFRNVRAEYRIRGLRAAEYTVLVSLGLGDRITCQELIGRAAKGGVELPLAAIESLTAAKLTDCEGDLVSLTPDGRRVLTELIAIAQATQLQLEDRLSSEEMGMLVHLLRRISE